MRHTLSISMWLVFLLVHPFACWSNAQVEQQSKPNVLLVVIDDLNLALGCYGDKKAITPNIDRIAAKGIRFKKAHCQFPLCGPSRVSFLTGRRPEATGVYVLDTPARVALPDSIQLPELFKQNGYHTVGAGKIAHSTRTNDPKTWDQYDDGAGEDPQEIAAIKQRYEGKDGRPRSHMLDSDGSKTRDGLNVEKIRKLISEHKPTDPPFFYALGLHKPHLPWTAPKEFFDLHPPGKFAKAAEPPMMEIPPVALQTELAGFEQPLVFEEAIRGYYACVSFIDSQIGKLLDTLDRTDLAKDTLIVLFSDHGFHLGDHAGLWSKQSAFDQSTHVPFLLAGPTIPNNRTIESPVELIDLFPTLTDLAGLPTTGTRFDGHSLRALWGMDDHSNRSAYSLVFHYDAKNQSDIMGRTVIADRWRYTEWNDGRGSTELYIHDGDPDEYHNRAEDPGFLSTRAQAAEMLRIHPLPKPGPANRPRALVSQ